ncbi:unnamed protein product, partial [Brachionus calyciflorus]
MYLEKKENDEEGINERESLDEDFYDTDEGKQIQLKSSSPFSNMKSSSSETSFSKEQIIGFEIANFTFNLFDYKDYEDTFLFFEETCKILNFPGESDSDFIDTEDNEVNNLKKSCELNLIYYSFKENLKDYRDELCYLGFNLAKRQNLIVNLNDECGGLNSGFTL